MFLIKGAKIDYEKKEIIFTCQAITEKGERCGKQKNIKITMTNTPSTAQQIDQARRIIRGQGWNIYGSEIQCPEHLKKAGSKK